VLKEKLASLMIKESEAVETISDLTTLIAEGNKHGVEDEVEGNIGHEDTHYNLHTDLTNNINNNFHTESPSTTSYLNSTKTQQSAKRFTANGIHDSEINKLKNNLERFAENITNRLEVLNEEVINIKESKVNSIEVLEDVINDLKNEKANLIKENTLLRETNEILSHGMSDLKSKMQELKIERQSLITVLKLLQGEHGQTDQEKRIQDLESEKESLSAALRILQQDLVDTQQNKWTTIKTKQNKAASKIPTEPIIINTSNQYSILTDSDTEEDDIQFQQRPITSTQTKRQINGASTSKEASHESPKAKQRNTDDGETRH
jgi:hypothetical protein